MAPFARMVIVFAVGQGLAYAVTRDWRRATTYVPASSATLLATRNLPVARRRGARLVDASSCGATWPALFCASLDERFDGCASGMASGSGRRQKIRRSEDQRAEVAIRRWHQGVRRSALASFAFFQQHR